MKKTLRRFLIVGLPILTTATSLRAAEAPTLALSDNVFDLKPLALRRPETAIGDAAPEQGYSFHSESEMPALNRNRMAVWGAITATAGYMAYNQSQASWGLSNGHFHFKDDLHDGLAMSDESSHLFAAYELTRALTTGYAWTEMPSSVARRVAAAHAMLWTFFVEYPIDAYNPTQGFGVSDLVFDAVGVLAGYQRTRPGPDPWWDIKISVKRSFFNGESRVIAYSNEQYDDYIYWLTVRPVRHRYAPVWLGAGYATTHRVWPQLDKELHLSVGTTIDGLAGMINKDAGRYLRPLNFFYLNAGTKIVWK